MKTLKLNSRVKIDSFAKLHQILGKKEPDELLVTAKQWEDYKLLFGKDKSWWTTPWGEMLFFCGIKLRKNVTKRR